MKSNYGAKESSGAGGKNSYGGMEKTCPFPSNSKSNYAGNPGVSVKKTGDTKR